MEKASLLADGDASHRTDDLDGDGQHWLVRAGSGILQRSAVRCGSLAKAHTKSARLGHKHTLQEKERPVTGRQRIVMQQKRPVPLPRLAGPGRARHPWAPSGRRVGPPERARQLTSPTFFAGNLRKSQHAHGCMQFHFVWRQRTMRSAQSLHSSNKRRYFQYAVRSIRSTQYAVRSK